MNPFQCKSSESSRIKKKVVISNISCFYKDIRIQREIKSNLGRTFKQEIAPYDRSTEIFCFQAPPSLSQEYKVLPQRRKLINLINHERARQRATDTYNLVDFISASDPSYKTNQKHKEHESGDIASSAIQIQIPSIGAPVDASWTFSNVLKCVMECTEQNDS